MNEQEKPPIPEDIENLAYDSKDSARSLEERMVGAQDDEAMLKKLAGGESIATDEERAAEALEIRKIYDELMIRCVKWQNYCQREHRAEDERRWLQARIALDDGEMGQLLETINYFIEQKKEEFDKAEKIDDREKCRVIGEQLSRLIEFQNMVDALEPKL